MLGLFSIKTHPPGRTWANFEKQNMISTVSPWCIVVNVLGLAISWPLAKHAMILYKIEYKYIVILVLTTILRFQVQVDCLLDVC